MKKFLLALFIFISHITHADPYTVIEDKAKLEILNPTFADRKTSKIQLPNGLKVLLISDPKLEQSAAVLTVNVGSWQDPDEYPGLAHFLEHMLFLGTKKYPKESEYQKFIAEQGGTYNAFTASDITSYLFAINNKSFPEALDRFSDFFKEPLFNPSGVDRELQAIDQEYAKNRENDDIRELSVIKELANPNHPDHRFTMGNSTTLAKVSRDALIKFYKEHYSANLMHLIIYSILPMDQLTQLVVENFSEIPNTNKQPLKIDTPIDSETIHNNIIYIEPVKNTRSLTFLWHLPQKFYEMKDYQPETIICFLLGHEGKESLLANLKHEKWAEGLKCGGVRLGPGALTIFIDIDLTDEGVLKYEEVIGRVFQAISILKEKEIPKYVFDEVQKVQTLHYQYQSRDDAFDTVMKEAMQITGEDLSTYPEQTLIIQKFNPEIIKQVLDYMTPGNAQFYLKAPSDLTHFETDRTEKWLGVSYGTKIIPSDKIEYWSQQDVSKSPIGLPAPNPFIPSKLDLTEKFDFKHSKLANIPHPQVVIDSDSAKIYFAHDSRYLTPSIYWYFEIHTPEIRAGNSQKTVLGELYIKALEDALNKFSYDAQMAGLNYDVKLTDFGFSVTIEGYNEKAQLLYDEILHQIKSVTISEDKFNLYKESLQRNYQNFSKELPLKQAGEELKATIYKNYSTQRQKGLSARRITYDKFNHFLSRLFRQTYVQGLFYGNMTEAQAKEQSQKLTNTFSGSIPYVKRPKTQVIVFPDNAGPFYLESSTRAQGNAVILAIEYSDFSFKARAAQQILMQAMTQPFFSTLRTVQQTGYIVYNSGEEMERQLFNFFAVQSNTHEVRDLLARFELFIEGYLQELGKAELQEEQFNKIRDSLILNLEQSATNQKTMGDLLKNLAFKYEGDFDWVDKRIQALKEISYEDFLTLSQEMLGRNNKMRLAILMKGIISEDNVFDYELLSNPNQLKKQSTYAPRNASETNFQSRLSKASHRR